jgi:GMP synthase-like glutamine amidotransferase
VRILHVEHPDGGGPGVFADVAPLETWRAWAEPPPRAEYDAVVLYGASTNVVEEDRLPWLRDELRWIGERLDDGVPMLGLCFGGQLLARALGGAVTRTSPEIGWLPVELTDAGRLDPVVGALPGRFEACQWHSWQFSLPDGAELLATSPAGVQGFRHGSTWGVQFHPEVDRPTLAGWIDRYDEDPDAVALGFDQDVARRMLDERIDGWSELGRRLFGAFLQAVAPGYART